MWPFRRKQQGSVQVNPSLLGWHDDQLVHQMFQQQLYQQMQTWGDVEDMRWKLKRELALQTQVYRNSWAAAKAMAQLKIIDQLVEEQTVRMKNVTPRAELALVPGYVVGYRSWIPSSLQFNHRLKSLNRTTVWTPGVPLQATCKRVIHQIARNEDDLVIPNRYCSCGVYAYNDWREVATNPEVTIHGEINLWGRIQEHRRGYRAEFGYPRCFYFDPVKTKLIERLAEQYGVPIVYRPPGT